MPRSPESPHTSPSNENPAELRVRELEAELAQVRAEGSQRASRGGSRWATALGATLLALAVILAPVSVVLSAVTGQLANTERFVSTYAPLAEDPAVQAVVTSAVEEVITESVDLPRITGEVFTALDGLGLPPQAQQALHLLEGPAALGLQQLLHGTVTGVVSSPAFASVWETSLRGVHQQLSASLNGRDNAAVSLSENGEIRLELAPFVRAVKSQLSEQGVSIAALIPEVDRSVLIAQGDAVSAAPQLVALTLLVSHWLPWVLLVFALLGLTLCRWRRSAFARAAVSGAVALLLVGGLLTAARRILETSPPSGALTPAAVSAVLEAVTGPMLTTLFALGTLALVLAIGAWLSGPARIPSVLRAAGTALVVRARTFGDEHRLATNGAGVALDRQRALARWAIVAAAGITLFMIRPLTTPTVLWVGLGTAALLVTVELLRRPAHRD